MLDYEENVGLMIYILNEFKTEMPFHALSMVAMAIASGAPLIDIVCFLLLISRFQGEVSPYQGITSSHCLHSFCLPSKTTVNRIYYSHLNF